MALNILQRAKLGNAEKLKELKELVAGQGGELSEDETEWHGIDHSYTFVFPVSRVPFKRSARAMKQGGWPKNESEYLRSKGNPNKGALILGDMREFAKTNKGKLISDQFIDSNKELYEFEYESGDRFYRTSDSIKRGWPKDYLKELQDIAKENEGTLEDTTYHGYQKLHKFAHKGGTEFFFRTPEKLKNKGWPINHLGVIRDIAEAHGGKLESKIWLGSNNPHDFINKDGIPFSMNPGKLKDLSIKDNWPEDIDKFFRNSQNYDSAVHCMEYMRKIAIDNGGELLPLQEWKGGVENLYKFKDQLGFEFEISYAALTTRNAWSPNRGLISEPVCRQAMKHLFSQDGLDAPDFFARWDIVTREGENPLELDGCSKVN